MSHTVRPAVRPATDPQRAYVTALLGQRVVPDTLREVITAELPTLSAVAASMTIDTLRGLPWRPRAAAAPVPELTDNRVYIGTDGAVVKVQRSRESGRQYGKVLDRDAGAFRFDSGALRHPGLRLLTGAEAEALSGDLHYCVNCGRHLTNEISIAAAMGPVCRGYYGA